MNPHDDQARKKCSPVELRGSRVQSASQTFVYHLEPPLDLRDFDNEGAPTPTVGTKFRTRNIEALS